MLYFAKSTGGFYDAAIHGNAIPADAVEITADDHAALLAAQSSGKVIQADLNGYPIAVDPPKPTPAQVWERIKAERDRRQLEGGVKVGQHWFKSDERATSEYNTIVNTTRGIPDNTVMRAGWRTMDGAEVNMTPALALMILTTGIQQRCAIDDVAQAHKVALDASNDPATYDFSSGWPAIFGG